MDVSDNRKGTQGQYSGSYRQERYNLLLESRIVIISALGSGRSTLGSLDDKMKTLKNSPNSSMPSCTIIIVIHSVVPEVRENANVSVTGV